MPELQPEDQDFLINYDGRQVNVSPVLNKGNIYFVVHLSPDVVIAEGMLNESWVWYEADNGETLRAAEIGALIELMDV